MATRGAPPLFSGRSRPAAFPGSGRAPGVACFHLPDLALWTAARSSGGPELVVHAEGKVVTCSPALQARGVAPGDALDRALSLAPAATLHRRDPQREELAAEEILRALNARTPRLQQLTDRRLHGMWVILSELTAPELQQLAVRSGAQAGMAPHRSVAMIAAAAAAPGQALVVPPGGVAGFLRQVPLRCLAPLGFSAELRQALDFLGLFRLGDCLFFSEHQLTARFGAEGRSLHRLLHPQGCGRASVFLPADLSLRHELEWPVAEPEALLPALQQLTTQAQQQLGDQVCRAVTLRLWLRAGAMRQQHAMLKSPTNSTAVLGYRLERLLRALLTTPHEVHRIELHLHGITGDTRPQRSLFAARPVLHDVLGVVERRFPGKLLRPVAKAVFCFPEEAFTLVPLTDSLA